MKKSVISIIMVVVVTNITLNSLVVDNKLYAGEPSKSSNVTMGVVDESEINSSVITDRLTEYMTESKDQTVPVTVQIKDDIDLEAIEQEALKNVGITAEELE